MLIQQVKPYVIGLVPDLICGFSQKSGIYWFSRALIKSLDELDRNTRFILFVPSIYANDFANLSERFTIARIPSLFMGDLANIFWHFFILPWLAWHHRVQLLHLFAGNRRLSLFPRRRTLVTVHDVYHYNELKLYDTHRFLFFRYVLSYLLRRQNHIHAVSGATADDLHRILGIPTESIHVIHNGYDHTRLAHLGDHESIGKIGKAWHKRPYLLYVSSLDHPRKNHLKLITGYEKVVLALADAPDLVFVGPDFSSPDVIYDAIRRSTVAERIHNLGYVSNSQLASLYQHAFAFVHPSLFEGYGYPLIEAMSFGLPVVCSDIAVFREVGGKAPLFFDPNNVDNIAETLLKVINDRQLRRECAARSTAIALAATKNCNAPLIYALYTQILERQTNLSRNRRRWRFVS